MNLWAIISPPTEAKIAERRSPYMEDMRIVSQAIAPLRKPRDTACIHFGGRAYSVKVNDRGEIINGSVKPL